MCEFSRVLNLLSLPDIYFKHTTFYFQSGWVKNVSEGTLSTIMLPKNIKSVPDEVSCVLTCNWQADEP